MHKKSVRLTTFMFTGCAVLLLASCASHESEFAPVPAPSKPLVSEAAPPAPQPASAPLPPATPPPPPAPVVAAPAPVVPAPAAVPQINPADLPASIIAWDLVDKSVTANPGELTTKFEFALTNVSAEPVTVLAVRASCSCTTAQLPPMPWTIEAGSNSTIHVNMNLAGKSGTVIKTVTFSTDKGTKHLLVRSIIQPLPSTGTMAPGAREQNQQLALADRQAVFRGDCASCHADVAKGKLGKELYVAACGVCHEAEHRATMVADLKVAKQERNEEYWRNWITNGKQGSLMPAFALTAGGILDEAQIASLVDYLIKNMPTKPSLTAIPTAVPPAH